MKWKIITDSGCDLTSLDQLAPETEYASVPLRIQIGEETFTDEVGADAEGLMEKLAAYKGKTSSACPSPDTWMREFLTADQVIAIPMTGGLSGSCGSARAARDMVLEQHPDKKIFVLDSLSVGPEMTLLAEKANELISKGLDFADTCRQLTQYHLKTHLIFVLSSLDNLVKNGRVSKLAGVAAGLLGIRVVGEASPQGTLGITDKTRGIRRTVAEILRLMKKNGCEGGRVVIAHVLNELEALHVAEAIREEFPQVNLTLMKSRGLCSYYAERHGLLIGYEG